MKEAVVGIDLGGTCTKFGLVTQGGNLLAQDSIPTNSDLSYEAFFEQLYNKIDFLKNGLDENIDLKGIGIGAPTGNYFLGTIENASNLNWLGEVPVTEVLESYSNLPAVLTNDANASAIGEMLYGAAKGVENFISITMGTGLGCGIVTNGKLVLGNNGHAGEIGHSTVYYGGRSCGCGREGCLETYVSATGLLRTIRELLETTKIESELRKNTSHFTAKKVTHAALQNDSLALEAFEYTGKILGLKLADIVAYMDPEVIILSGGLAKAGTLILEPAKKYMEEHMLDVYKNKVEIISSGLTEENAAILGAAAFSWNELENKKRL